ncbi:MAG: hypothetical protein LUQ65_01025 [Candidatus Helarchaeota archaeon]|nr:hypothetical protein [Candidatus Helarchaeota archaeon]
MREIVGVYVCEEDGTMIFEYSPSEEGEEEAGDSSLLAGMILSVQTFARNLGEKSGSEIIEMGKIKILLAKDEETKIIFVLKCIKEANDKRVTKLFEKIQKTFNTAFKPYFKKYSPKELKLYINNLFSPYLQKLLK